MLFTEQTPDKKEQLGNSVTFIEAALSSIHHPNRCIPSSVQQIVLGRNLTSVAEQILHMTEKGKEMREAGSTFFINTKTNQFLLDPVRSGTEQRHFAHNLKPCEDNTTYIVGGAHGHPLPYPHSIMDIVGLLHKHPKGASYITDMELVINAERLLLLWRSENTPLLDTDTLIPIVYSSTKMFDDLVKTAQNELRGRRITDLQEIAINQTIQKGLFNSLVSKYGFNVFTGNIRDGILKRIKSL